MVFNMAVLQLGLPIHLGAQNGPSTSRYLQGSRTFFSDGKGMDCPGLPNPTMKLDLDFDDQPRLHLFKQEGLP